MNDCTVPGKVGCNFDPLDAGYTACLAKTKKSLITATAASSCIGSFIMGAGGCVNSPCPKLLIHRNSAAHTLQCMRLLIWYCLPEVALDPIGTYARLGSGMLALDIAAGCPPARPPARSPSNPRHNSWECSASVVRQNGAVWDAKPAHFPPPAPAFVGLAPHAAIDLIGSDVRVSVRLAYSQT